ncbi:MAG: GspH/FimT family pseudopilin [Thermodesulfobacteriota bacterium]
MTRKRFFSDREKGFTIMELMVVIAIVGILTALIVPNIVTWRNNSMVSGAVRVLMHDLNLAKARAITEGSRVSVLFSDKGYAAFLDNGANPNNFVREADETILIAKELTGISVQNTTFTNDRLFFNSRGICSENGDVVLGMSGVQKRVVVSRVGRITIP